MKASKPAFTLMEVMIVLGLVSLLLVIVFFPAQCLKDSYQEQQFWRIFNQAWTKTALTSERKGCVAEVAFRKKYIDFVNYDEDIHGEKRTVQRLELPKSLEILSGFAYADFYKNGGTKFERVVFYSHITKKKYIMIPQVGFGGRYRLEIK